MSDYRYDPQPFGKYLLTERIGAGGMAEIFRATAYGVEGFTKEVCIKRILPNLTADETFIRMFISEAKLAVTLHHINIVQVFDLGRIGEHYFIAMELVRGRDLLQIINRCRSNKRRIPVHIALYLLSRVCKGLDYAHRVRSEGRPAGIIHRDVSPSNILVSWEGEVKVADFGIAKASHKDEKTATDTLKGKYGYMSPEQVKGFPTDHRSDIFAAGILLYETLAGRRLFKGVTDLETLEKVRAAEIPTLPSEMNKRVPPEVDRIVLKALASDADKRFQSAGEFHDALADQLFASGKRVDSKALSAFMQKLFASEIEEEDLKERERSQPGFPPPPISGAVQDDVHPLTPTPTPAVYMRGPSSNVVPLPSVPPVSMPPDGRQVSSVLIGTLATGFILLAAAIVVGIFWIANRPNKTTPPDPVVVSNPTPPKSTPETPATGTLSINSQPRGAAIEIDGKRTGLYTPASIQNLDLETAHLVKLVLHKHKPWTRQVEFGDMEMVALEAQLTAIASRPPSQPRRSYGTLNINAVPVWAYVYVDGQKQSKPTPIYNLRLKPGSHTIRLVNPKLKLSRTRKVTIQKGKKVDLVVRMK